MMSETQSDPLFDWCDHRAAGTLLHPTSFPSETGIGNFGGVAYKFIDMLASAGMRYWQLCPLGPTGFGDSPYQSFSAFAGNPYLIDWKPLQEAGLIRENELQPLLQLPRDRVDYGALYRSFWPIMDRAATRYCKSGSPASLYGNFDRFYEENRSWLEPYAWFMIIKKAYHGGSWDVWDAAYQNFKRAKKSGLPKGFSEESLRKEVFYQYIFHGQWMKLKAYANHHGIEIIGDLPIFVSYDSCDLWTYPDWFQVNSKTGKLKATAGVPPDFFSSDGQLWGNPLYDWEALQADGYTWWMDRLAMNFKLYDVVRIDHFRAFHDYWKIPAGAKSARKGKWVPGPGLPFFKALKEKYPDARIIAEDLGELSPGVESLRRATGLPGMAVLQFAFDGPENAFLPHNHDANLAVYPGTHDNDTSLSWYESADESIRDLFRRYLRVDGSSAPWDLIRAAYASPGQMAIIPLQDLMSLGTEARFNTPGTRAGNWQWRYSEQALHHFQEQSLAYLRELAWLYQRLPEQNSH